MVDDKIVIEGVLRLPTMPEEDIKVGDEYLDMLWSHLYGKKVRVTLEVIEEGE